jgi:hypothetical protein
MKLVRFSLVAFLLFCTLSASEAQAKISDTTQSLAAGQLSIASEFEAGLRNETPFNLNLHENIGLKSGLDLVIRQQIRVSDGDGLLLGGGVKWTLLPKRVGRAMRPGVALWLTGFFDTNSDDAGFRGHFMVDNTWGNFTPYLALDLDVVFSDEVETPFTLIGGTRWALVRNVAAFFEGGLGLNEATEFLSAGLRVTL